MDDVKRVNDEENINLEELELIHNLPYDDSYDDGIFPSLDFMMDIDDE